MECDLKILISIQVTCLEVTRLCLGHTLFYEKLVNHKSPKKWWSATWLTRLPQFYSWGYKNSLLCLLSKKQLAQVVSKVVSDTVRTPGGMPSYSTDTAAFGIGCYCIDVTWEVFRCERDVLSFCLQTRLPPFLMSWSLIYNHLPHFLLREWLKWSLAGCGFWCQGILVSG